MNLRNSFNNESFATSEQTGYRFIQLKSLFSALSVAREEGKKIVRVISQVKFSKFHAKSKVLRA